MNLVNFTGENRARVGEVTGEVGLVLLPRRLERAALSSSQIGERIAGCGETHIVSTRYRLVCDWSKACYVQPTASVPSPTITCIYCKEEKPRPARGEHVVLAGLGGRATIPDVCQGCNSFLGNTLDREFLRSTHVALDRFFDPEVRDGELASPQFRETEFGFLDVRLHNSGQVETLPQVLLHEGRLLVVSSSDSDHALVAQVLARFVEQELVPRSMTKDVPQHKPTRLVVDRNQKRHLIRTANHADA